LHFAQDDKNSRPLQEEDSHSILLHFSLSFGNKGFQPPRKKATRGFNPLERRQQGVSTP